MSFCKFTVNCVGKCCSRRLKPNQKLKPLPKYRNCEKPGKLHSQRKKKYGLFDGRRRLKNNSTFRAFDATEIAIDALSKLAKGQPVKVNVRKELGEKREMLKNEYELLKSKTIRTMTNDEKRKLWKLEKIIHGYQEHTPKKEAKIIRIFKRRINIQQKKNKEQFERSIVEGTVEKLIQKFGNTAVSYFDERFSKRGK